MGQTIGIIKHLPQVSFFFALKHVDILTRYWARFSSVIIRKGKIALAMRGIIHLILQKTLQYL